MGNGTRASLGKRGRMDRSIAHNDVAARATFAAVEGCECVFPKKRGSAHGTFAPARKRISGSSFQDIRFWITFRLSAFAFRWGRATPVARHALLNRKSMRRRATGVARAQQKIESVKTECVLGAAQPGRVEPAQPVGREGRQVYLT